MGIMFASVQNGVTDVKQTTKREQRPIVSETVEVEAPVYISSAVEQYVEVKTLINTSSDLQFSREEIELIALVTMAEAEGESEEGQRLVIDTILNRVDSDLSYFPDTVHDVIYQKNAFSSVWGDRINQVEVTDEMVELVKEEIESRTNYDVMYFRTNHYSNYGTPLFVVGGHYFSSN